MKIKIPFTKRQIQITKAQHGFNISYSIQGAWMPINQKSYIDNGYKLNANLYSVINRIARTAAMTWWQLFDISKDKEEEILHHPVLDLLENPNGTQSRREWIEAAVGYKLLLGERFILKASPENGNNKGKTKELYLLSPPDLNIKFDEIGNPLLYKFKSGREFNGREIIYSRLWDPASGYFRGLSPVQAGHRVITQSNDTYLASSKLLQSMGAQGILSLDDKDAELTQSQIDDVEKKMQEKYGGPDTPLRAMVTSYKFNWLPIGLKAADLGLHEAQKMTLREICNLYGISSRLFNDPENTTFNNVKEARKDMIANVILPELESLTGELNRGLLPEYFDDPKRFELRINTKVFPELKEDEQTMVNVLSLAWWLSPNRRRVIMGEEEHSDPLMDDIYLPTGLMPIGTEPIQQLGKLLELHSKKNGSPN